MSRLETPMTRRYWESIGGLLKEEFCLVRPTKECGIRLADAVILPQQETRIADRGEEIEINGQHVVVVQTKASRLGMYLMGQALFSGELIRRYFKPLSVESVALCAKDDRVLRPLLEAHAGCSVVVMPPESFAAAT